MSPSDERNLRQSRDALTIDFAIRIGFVALLGYWSARILAPLMAILLWSSVLAVALYPLYDRLAQRVGPRPASAIVTLLCLVIVAGPLTWLGLGMVNGIRLLTASAGGGDLALPLPPDKVKNWPIVGNHLYQFWSLAANNLQAALAELLPLLKHIGQSLFETGQGALVSLIELLLSIILAAFMLVRGPLLVAELNAFLECVLSRRGKDLVKLAGATIRNVSRGIVGVSILQALLAGAGFLVAGIPAAGLLAFVTLVLGIIQIGPTLLFLPIIIWAWTAMDGVQALAFTAYMVPVALVDNVLKPLLMSRGLNTPLPVVMMGVIGGTLSQGMLGLFFGPVVLSVAWAILMAWVHGHAENPDEQTPL